MHLHVLGICGTFMAGLARLARELGHQVSGSDAHTYPPMSDQLAALDIEVREGYEPAHLEPAPDCVVVGNALSRGNPAVEHMLDRGLRYRSGPAWLAENVLEERWVLGVSGTHGKTTVTGMLAWILEDAGLSPGFLVGGVPGNFDVSARLGGSPFFVVEADEYDTAFFDKRSKFVHYRPRTLVVNNLEFDHADIFPDLEAIERQFHHLVRTVPGNGLIVHPADDVAVSRVLEMGCWTPRETLGPGGWRAEPDDPAGHRFHVYQGERAAGCVDWDTPGAHNRHNALAAIAAARHAGVPTEQACEALGRFRNARRRLELRGSAGGIALYDDFAHHPTAIAATLAALRAEGGDGRLIAVLEPASNTMRMGVHARTLGPALAGADLVWVFLRPDVGWDTRALEETLQARGHLSGDLDTVVAAVARTARPGDRVVVMSNSGFGGIHERLLDALGGTHD